jgi:signal transduction histidine kinase
MIEALGTRRQLTIPMLRAGEPIGAITMGWDKPAGFDDQEASLLKTFADQAVIAVENVRLFNETKDALERQTATAEILKVIASSPSDVQPVFNAIAASAKQLLGGLSGVVTRVDGGMQHLAAFTTTGESGDETLRRLFPMPRGELISGRAITTLAPAIRTDTETDPSISEAARENARARGYRSALAVPMVREGVAIGAISVARGIPGSFSDHQIGLLQTFADQAIIAIENVRLFNETKEALDRQTAISEILEKISSSPTDVLPVLQAVAARAAHLCEGEQATVLMVEGDMLRPRVTYSSDQGPLPNPSTLVYLKRGYITGRAALDAEAINVEDAAALMDSEYTDGRENQQKLGYRSFLAVPMMREGKAIGVIAVWRRFVRKFSDKHVALVKTFADQAAIAIENVRLFNELQARTEALTKSVRQLTALGEVGQAISSTLDLETVLKTIVSRAVQLTGLDAGAVYEYDERAEEFHLRAAENMSEEIIELLRSTPIKKGDGAVGATAVAREPIQIPEIRDEGFKSQFREVLIRTGRRALLAVPLMREDHIIGALAVQRNTPGPFAPEVVEVLKTFATHSAMAMQNARLFREIAEKGRQLEVASEHKSQFLASMSHELRTPLNALLGFNEMILGDIYGEVPGDMRPPLAQMQTSGKHLLRLINNVLDLAKIEAGRMELALADYSVQDVVEGVRSTLQPLAVEKGLEFLAAVPADVPLAHGDSGRITQCLMNLAGNSLKFTKAGKVEISVVMNSGQLRYCVADTGIGIPRDKIGSLFTEFRQTDATVASEYGGTGLGLSISKKFVEMHGGRIWVESEPGRGSVFTFEVPLRAAAA